MEKLNGDHKSSGQGIEIVNKALNIIRKPDPGNENEYAYFNQIDHDRICHKQTALCHYLDESLHLFICFEEILNAIPKFSAIDSFFQSAFEDLKNRIEFAKYFIADNHLNLEIDVVDSDQRYTDGLILGPTPDSNMSE